MKRINWFSRSENPKDLLCVGERVGYAFSNTGIAFTYILILGFMSFYYTDVIGIPAGVVGTIILVSRVFDGISDIIMGIIVDKTKSKLGKARPWLLGVAIPHAIACIAAFAVPTGWTSMQQYIYVLVTYNILNTVTYTISYVSITVLNNLITDSQEEHAKSGIWLQIGGSTGMLIVQYSCFWLVGKLGDNPNAWTMTAAIYSLIGAALMLTAAITVRERVIRTEETMDNDKITFIKRVKLLFKNKYWIIYTSIFLIFTVIEQGTFTGAAYYAQYIMGDISTYATFSTVQTGVQVVLLIVAMTYVQSKFGNVKLTIGCFVLTIIASVIQSFVWTMPVVIFCSILRGMSYALFLGAQGSIIADTCSYGSKLAGFGMEGISNAGISFGYKFGTGIGMAIVGWILQLSGYDGTLSMQTPGALMGIKIVYLILPLVLSVVCIIFMMFFDLYKKQAHGEVQL